MLFSLNRKLPERARVTRKAEGSAIRRTIAEFRQVLAVRWARIVLLSVFFEGAFLFGAFAFIASHLHHVHHISLTTAATLVMLYGLGGLLYASASHRLVPKLGENGLSLWGGVLVALSLIAIGLAPAWWWAIPGCFVAGLGFYMLHNTLQMNATQMAPERRGAAMSAFSSFFYMGQSAGVALAGFTVGRWGTAAVICTGAIGMLLVGMNFARKMASR